MLARIFAAIRRALQNTLGWFGGLAAMPFKGFLNALFPGSGDGLPPSTIPPAPDVSELAAEVKAAKAAKREATGLRVATSVQTWAIESLLAGAHVPLPPGIPSPMAMWLKGLDRKALETLGSADSHRVAGHLTGQHRMPGVASVRLLPIADLRQGPPDPSMGSGGFLLSADPALRGDDAEPAPGAGSGGSRKRRRDRAPQLMPALP